MTMTTISRSLIAALCTAVVAGPAIAQPVKPQSPLERQQGIREIANQKADSDTREGVAAIEKLARVQPDRALRDLKNLALSLDTRTDITSSKREELIAYVNNRIAAIQGRGTVPNVKDPVLDPARAARMAENKQQIEKYNTEVKEVNDAISAVERDFEMNRSKEAEQRIAAISRKYPNNPATLYLGAAGKTTDRVATARAYAHEQSNRWVSAMRDVDKSALPAIGDIEFPKDWKEKMERRRKLEPQLYGPEETKILETLEKPVTLKFKDAPFEESVQSLSTALDLPIYLDKQSLDDLAVDMKKPVTVPPGVTGRTALRAMLQSVGLTFIIKDKVLQVVSVEKSRLNYVTRAYDVSDLVRSGGPFNSPVLWGPVLDFQQTQQNAQVLVEMIQKSIDPLVWQQPNGGTVTFHYPSMSMIIRAPSEVHATLGKALKR